MTTFSQPIYFDYFHAVYLIVSELYSKLNNNIESVKDYIEFINNSI